MKVLVLAQYFPPDMGGGSTRASNVVNGLVSCGCEVTVVTAFPHYPHGIVPKEYRHKAMVNELLGSVRVCRVWIPSIPHNSNLKRIFLHFTFVLSSLFALPFVGKTDVIWGANPNLFSFFPMITYGIIKRAPIARNVDDLWPEVFYEMEIVRSKYVKKFLDFLARISYVIPDVITPISTGYKRAIVAKYGIDPAKIHVIEVGVKKIPPMNTIHDSGDRFVVMYSGVLGLGYDLEVVLEGAKILENEKGIFFVIRGVGEMADKLRQSIEASGLQNIVLDTRFLSKDDLESFLNSSDVFILPMANSNIVDLGLPTKVFEYQAHGKPIVCVSNGEAARYVESTRSGIIVKPKDASGFAKAVLALYTDRESCLKFGLNGRRYVSEFLTSEMIGKRMIEVLTKINEGTNLTCG
ncbi:MAG: glycosyltransferase family 4 protein [Candidatus Bathyarchaeia archaeon]|jgi:glycosyltransferase involved in cell wall biosynthesis